MDYKSQIEEQLQRVLSNEATPDTFFSLLWRAGIFLEGKDFTSLLNRAIETLPSDPKIESWISFSYAFESFLNARHLEMFDKLFATIEKFKALNDAEGEGAAHGAMGMTYFTMGQVDRARNHFHEAISRLTKDGIYKHFLKMCLYQAGELYSSLQDFPQAIELFSKGLEATADDPGMTGRMLNGIGNIHLRKGEYEQAFEFFRKSLNKVEDSGNVLMITRNYSDIATYYIKTGDVPKAKTYIEKSLEMRLSHNIANPMVAPAITNYMQLANIHFDEQNFQLALDNAEKALEMASRLKIMSRLAEVSEMMYRIHEARGDMENAFLHFKNFHKYKQEALNLESARKMQQIEVHHEVERMKQEKEIFRLRNVELKSALDDIEASIQYAKRLQEAMLPNASQLSSSFSDHFILYAPKDIVSGDFYWMDKKDDLLFFAVGDCTGHGVPGAMVSILCQTALNRALNEFSCVRPADILNKTRELVISAFMKSEAEVKDGMDITICSLCLKTHTLEFAGANNPIYLIKNGELQEIKGDKQPIGYFPDMKPFTNHTFAIEPGTVLYLFSDGFADQFGGELGKKFKYSQLKNLLLGNHKRRMQEQKGTLTSTFNEWKAGYEQVDDVTLMGIKI